MRSQQLVFYFYFKVGYNENFENGSKKRLFAQLFFRTLPKPYKSCKRKQFIHFFSWV